MDIQTLYCGAIGYDDIRICGSGLWQCNQDQCNQVARTAILATV
ncbi:hypothetical protein [Oceanicoccus sp.]|nr:hypothetical protein [Oceanicoccus sp.]